MALILDQQAIFVHHLSTQDFLLGDRSRCVDLLYISEIYLITIIGMYTGGFGGLPEQRIHCVNHELGIQQVVHHSLRRGLFYQIFGMPGSVGIVPFGQCGQDLVLDFCARRPSFHV